MAIAFDNSAFISGASGSYTMGLGPNGLLIAWAGQNGLTDPAPIYGGHAMTKYSPYSDSDGNFLYYLFNPPTGANTLSFTGTPQACVLSYTGVSQTGFPDAATSALSGSGSTLSATLTPVATGAWGIFLTEANRNFSTSVSNYTRRAAATSNMQSGDTNGIISGSTTMSWTQSSAAAWFGIMITISPAVASAASPKLALLGVG